MKMPILKNIKKNLNEENKKKLVILLAILVFLWIIYFLIPSIFVLLFTTFLGKIILLLFVILVSIKDFSYGVILAICLIIFSRFSYLSSKSKEGFKWGEKRTNDFLKVQRTLNHNKVFLMDEITKQATKEEADFYLENGFWYWEPEVENLYLAHSLNNPLIQTSTRDSVRETKKVYNQKAILEILADQTKEGVFMAKGVEVPTGKNDMSDGSGFFGYNSGLISNLYNKRIKCYPENKNSKKYVLKSTEYLGNEGILGSQIWETKNVDVNNLENIIPGFKFLKGPCNPCSAIPYSNNPSYDCPFSLKLKNTRDIKYKSGVSEVWKYLWKLGGKKINENDIYSKNESELAIDANTFEQPHFNT
jgi:hypothetical protein